MFAKIFRQIFDSSIAEHPEVRVTFMDMLILADRNGVVDMTHESIARTTNRPLNVIKKTIAALEKPDPRSRTPESDGRRLIRLDDHRDWGWMIVNYSRFRNIASEEHRREKNLEAVKRYRESKRVTKRHTSVTPSHATSCNSCHAEAEAEAEADVKKKNIAQIARLYELYPRHVGKLAAFKAIEKALSLASFEVLDRGVKRYAAERKGEDPKFTKHPATWFNGQHWLDETATKNPPIKNPTPDLIDMMKEQPDAQQ